MAVKHNFTILCDYMMQDVSGKYALIGTFQNVLLDIIPGALTRMCVLVGYEADAGDVCRIEFRDPKGKLILKTDDEVATGLETIEHQTGMNMAVLTMEPTFPFSMEGRYSVILRGNGKIVHKLNFGVLLRSRTEGGDDVKRST